MNVTYDSYLAALIGGNYSVSSRVGVCQNGVYGSVCDANWDHKDANVICNSFGFGLNFGE